MKKTFFSTLLAMGLSVLATGFANAAPVVRQGSGANTAAIQSTVDQFRTVRPRSPGERPKISAHFS